MLPFMCGISSVFFRMDICVFITSQKKSFQRGISFLGILVHFGVELSGFVKILTL